MIKIDSQNKQKRKKSHKFLPACSACMLLCNVIFLFHQEMGLLESELDHVIALTTGALTNMAQQRLGKCMCIGICPLLLLLEPRDLHAMSLD